MPIFSKKIQFNHEDIWLTNQRAIFWKKHEALILSDLHIGKTAHFRKHGIPISAKVLEHDLERLDALIQHFEAKTLLIVGDLFHAEFNGDITFFHNWKNNHKDLKIVLIKGNHDRNNFELYESLNMLIVKNHYNLEPFVFTHDMKRTHDENFYISGHIHPGVMIKGKGRQRIKLPCYQVFSNAIILPAFSLFTGLNTKKTETSCINYAFTETDIFQV